MHVKNQDVTADIKMRFTITVIHKTQTYLRIIIFFTNYLQAMLLLFF